MRYIFKTSYGQDIDLVKHGGQTFWYGLLGVFLLLSPWILPEYLLAQLIFVLIYSVVGLGLMLLSGFTGQFSIGHAAFMGVGAYTQAVLSNAGWPFPLSLACAGGLSAIVVERCSGVCWPAGPEVVSPAGHTLRALTGSTPNSHPAF